MNLAMSEVINLVSNLFSNKYQWFLSLFSPNTSLVLEAIIFAIFLSIISLFIWEFYNSTSKRNLIDLNLRQYNHSQHPFLGKLFAIVLFFIEYIIVMPMLISLWFAGLAIVLLLLADPANGVEKILFVTAAMIGATRFLSYYNREISKDLAKLFPFILLSVFLLTPGAFNLGEVLLRSQDIPNLLGNIFFYLLAVFIIEIILRFFYTIYEFFDSEDPQPSEEDEE